MTESEEGSLTVLLEEMNDKFSLVLEGHDAIRHEFKEQINEIKEEQQLFKSLLKGSHDELKSEIQGVRTELKEEIQGVRTGLKEEIRGVRIALKEEIRGVRIELKEEIRGVRIELKETREELREEMASGFNALGSKVEGHEDRIRFLERKAA